MIAVQLRLGAPVAREPKLLGRVTYRGARQPLRSASRRGAPVAGPLDARERSPSDGDGWGREEETWALREMKG
jgi:hypothetical protein